ncbi:MAG: hypothetical protein UU51_C0010G0004 [Microgenomates group bacterium GW2011_GWC1_41_20]|uniref:Uncharacterized protein n=7 Tax=Candidatus Woeseibacteriota TaxID=1752722 RepID=A0A0G0U994_9BACT|nr:MAG: hypothetical protein UT76_C0003G0018 [Candidatus Woesebacteria bacterium GW2011_GWB1_40_12]KKR56060.1 MAG: hypothetical protein UT93_C0006G0011 [Candidatus Woesebacteria bacterium GW2011_GWF1_40_24]KKR88995.1 MAG: hypothetical protein UU39_C0046G0003 [Candidatus Woesebacteria bacterium GW2011_GWD1_41_12]KKS00345.1 MAG: hypothetical protein UU51_C0010G0004 [Microgenomates group bacterium GW2011_GWC1_41_20]KKS05738.1 MAG: hypothetical protein UU57_C0001G0003 [Candidatus Woesebacteria bact
MDNEQKLLEKAHVVAKEMAAKAQEKGSFATFRVETVATGINSGKINILKEKPDGEIVIYPQQID